MTSSTETLTVRDLAQIVDEPDDLGRVAEYLGADWAGQPKGREVIVSYPAHNRHQRIDSETAFEWAD